MFNKIDINSVKLNNIILLSRMFGVGSKKGLEVLKKLNETKLLNNTLPEIADKLKLTPNVKSLFVSADYKISKHIIKDCNKHNIKILTYFDKEYPDVLRNLEAPPFLLYIKGTLPDFDNLPSISVVGPRKCSDFGEKAAFSLGYRLAKSGMIVVSGGAVGCDSFAHKGALKSGGITVLVLGCGIMSDYLPNNKAMREAISKTGCLISEYPPFEEPTKYTFPIRNRIISGLTLGTVVIEASERSGALITASHAMEQGKDVFVIPGNPTLYQYKGSNKLLRDGAKPLIDASDIFNEYLPDFPDKIDVKKAFERPEKIKNTKKIQKNFNETLSNEAKIVYNYLDKQIFTTDDLCGANLSSDDILSAITELEFEHLIEALPGGKYKKI